MIELLAFDADDTLWHTERIYLESKARLVVLLEGYHPAEWIDERLNEVEMRNLRHFGYGIKSFTLSMIETAIELTEGRIKGSEIQEIVALARGMLQMPIQLLDDVEDTIHGLAQAFELMIITKGDLFEQESKIAASGLGDLFSHVEIVSEKDRSTYEAIVSRHSIDPRQMLMVGNSLRSDILPVLDAGGRAVHIPYETTWQHEHVPEDVAGQYQYFRAESIREVPGIVSKLNRD